VRVSVYLPLLLPVLALRGIPLLGRRLAPAVAARVLTGICVAAGLGTVAGLGLVAAAGLSRTDEVLTQTPTHVSADVLAVLDPVPRTLGALAAAVLLVALTRLAVVSIRHARLARAMAQVGAGTAAGELVVFTSTAPHAYAVPGGRGRAGRIVVSDGMLRRLDAPGRRVLLAHERAHLRHHHHRYRAVAEAVATLNPLLRRLRDQVVFALERWADEDAATAVGDRRTTATCLAHAALATTAPAMAAGSGFVEHAVPARVRALLGDPVATRPAAAVAPLAVVLIGAAALGDAGWAFTRILAALLG